MTYSRTDVADMYRHTFAARLDIYSAWTPNGWRPRREELTVDTVLSALAGKTPSVSTYATNASAESHIMAFDFDTDDGLAQARRLVRVMDGYGLPGYVETSRRGAHLWCIIDWVMPAATIRRAARWLMGEALLPDDPHIELRPGSDELAEGGIGHAIRMPLMPHPKTGQRGDISDAAGDPLRSLVDLALGVDHASASLLADLASRYRPVIDRLPSDLRQWHNGEPKDDGSVTDILVRLWGVNKARPGVAVRCPAHEESGLGRDGIPSLQIYRHDKRVLCHVPGCLLNNNGRGRGTHELVALARRT